MAGWWSRKRFDALEMALMLGTLSVILGTVILQMVPDEEPEEIPRLERTFGIVLPHVGSLERPTRLAHRIVAETSRLFVVAGAATRLGVGIGIAIAPDNGDEVDELLRRADLALYRAKALGRSHVCFFTTDMDAQVERRMRLERALRAAIETESVVPHYQPLVSLDGNRIGTEEI